MSDITNPIPILVYMSLYKFRPLLRDVLRDLIALWADAGTPELVGGSAAHTLILRRDALPIQCAQVRVQADTMLPDFQCHIEIEFIGDASTIALLVAFLNAFANGLPPRGYVGSNDTTRKILQAFAAQYAKLLPPPTAKPIQAAAAPLEAKPSLREPYGMHDDTRMKLNDLIQQRAKRIQSNQTLLSRTEAYPQAKIHTDTVKRWAPELHEKWMDRDYLPSEFT